MDFIKTSSLRALIELTFQRNWNGLIWMSRKGVITKRVKTVQTALSRISAQPLAEERCSALGQTVCPTEVSAKVQTTRPITHHDPGNIVPRSAKPTSRHTAHDQSARAGKQASRPRNPSRTTADASVRAGKNVPRPAEKPSAKSHPLRPRRPTVNPSDPDRSDSATTRLSGRSSRTTVPTPRSTRSPFEAQTYVFKPGLTLSRL
ncbi:unnamed protein product [Microthlaspi erraticum]|uniref:Uncharacterized protein n=1 Tax=Microthlaspi erraticum TaxID=1685480 RepID=A0A6D2L229_9BRAS|nr:unnamed protein product [Microthlaspi erraticum]